MSDFSTTDLDSLSKLAALGFEGADASLSEALGYGLVWKDLGDSYLFVFKRGGTGKWDRRVVPKDIDVRRRWIWADFPELDGFTGHADWPNGLHLTEIIADLLGYYGDYNVFGGPGHLFYVDLEDAPAPDAEWFSAFVDWKCNTLFGWPVWIRYGDGLIEKGEARECDEDGFLVSTDGGAEIPAAEISPEQRFSLRKVA